MKKRRPPISRKKKAFRICPSVYKETQIGAKCPRPKDNYFQTCVSCLPPNNSIVIREIKNTRDKIIKKRLKPRPRLISDN